MPNVESATVSCVVAVEQRGQKTKRGLEIDPLQVETVRLIFRRGLEGNGNHGPMGIKSITKHLNDAGIRTGDYCRQREIGGVRRSQIYTEMACRTGWISSENTTY